MIAMRKWDGRGIDPRSIGVLAVFFVAAVALGLTVSANIAVPAIVAGAIVAFVGMLFVQRF
jgi:hypothetical protein